MYETSIRWSFEHFLNQFLNNQVTRSLIVTCTTESALTLKSKQIKAHSRQRIGRERISIVLTFTISAFAVLIQLHSNTYSYTKLQIWHLCVSV